MDQLNRSNKHRATVIEIYEAGMVAAVKFDSGRIESIKHPGTSPNGDRWEFYIGQRGMVDYVRNLTGYQWSFEPFKSQKNKELI